MMRVEGEGGGGGGRLGSAHPVNYCCLLVRGVVLLAAAAFCFRRNSFPILNCSVVSSVSFFEIIIIFLKIFARTQTNRSLAMMMDFSFL